MKRIICTLLFASSFVGAFCQTPFTATLLGTPVNTAGWTLSSASYVSGNTIVLTDPVGTQAGYAYYSTPINLNSCSAFSVSFEFQVTNSSAPPADGIAFWFISNPPSAFVAGGGVGLPNNPNGLVYIMDTYDNDGNLNNPLLSLRYMNGTYNYTEGSATGLISPDVLYQNFITNSAWHSCVITYNNSAISVSYDGNPPIMTGTYPVSLNGYFGFSASTGALWSKHSIRNVTLSGTAPPPAPTVVSPVNYCQNATAAPLTATGVNLRWYTVATGGTALAGAPTPNTGTVGSTTWYVAQAGTGTCESIRTPITVTVSSSTSAPVAVSPVNYCQGATPVPLIATPGTGNTLRWYTTPTGGTATTTAPIPDANTPGITTYYVSQTNTACGEGPRSPIVVNVGIKPPPPTTVTPLVYCMGDNALPLTAGGSGLTWYSQPAGGVGTTTPPIPNTAYEDTLTYWVTQTPSGCESIRTKQVVQIRFKPNGIILGTQQSICQGDVDTFYYYGNGRPSFIYNFHTNVGTTTLINDSVAGRYIVRFDSSGTFPIRMQVNNDGCVSNDMFYYVTVRPSPYMSFTLKPDACVGEVVNVALDYTSSSVTNYTYDFDNGNIIYGTATGGPYGISWTTPGTKLLKVLGVTTGCPSRLFNNSIRIHPTPDASFTASTLNICTGDTIRFKARGLDSDVHYTWTPDNFFVDGNIYSALGTVYQQGYVKLTVTSVYGCTSADSLYITAKPCCELFFPNVFSPNNDGHNDVFKPVTIGHHEVANFRIVNRWGQTVFETKDEQHGWDGTFNGRDQDVGTYYYYIKYICTGNQYQEQKGELMLVR